MLRFIATKGDSDVTRGTKDIKKEGAFFDVVILINFYCFSDYFQSVCEHFCGRGYSNNTHTGSGHTNRTQHVEEDCGDGGGNDDDDEDNLQQKTSCLFLLLHL